MSTKSRKVSQKSDDFAKRAKILTAAINKKMQGLFSLGRKTAIEKYELGKMLYQLRDNIMSSKTKWVQYQHLQHWGVSTVAECIRFYDRCQKIGGKKELEGKTYGEAYKFLFEVKDTTEADCLADPEVIEEQEKQAKEEMEEKKTPLPVSVIANARAAVGNAIAELEQLVGGEREIDRKQFAQLKTLLAKLNSLMEKIGGSI